MRFSLPLTIVVLGLLSVYTLSAQRVGIGTATPANSSLLDLNATDKALRLTRVADTSSVLNPKVEGLFVYNQNDDLLYYHDGLQWIALGTSTPGWQLIGNGGTTPGTGAGQNYLGTTDATDFIIGTDATERVRVESGGNVGIGTVSAEQQLHVNQNAHVEGYLKVGDLAMPTPSSAIVDNDFVPIYQWAGEFQSGWTTDPVCGAADWVGNQIANNNQLSNLYLTYIASGVVSKSRLVSPWVYIPSTANLAETYIQISYITDFYLQSFPAAADICYLEYSTDGTAWTKVPATSFLDSPYNAGATTGFSVTDACFIAGREAGWTGTSFSPFINLSTSTMACPVPAGNWIRFRLVAQEAIGFLAAGTSFNMSGFSVYGKLDQSQVYSGTFEPGNIYAENNIFAGSNVLLGDMAEYLPVIGPVEPGDLISIAPGGSDQYVKTTRETAQHIVGVYSTNPTLTLNSPRAGKPVALRGRVPVKVNLEGGEIKAGDYLTASSVPGVASKANGNAYVVGRALEPLKTDSKTVLCLIENGWYHPAQNTVGMSVTGAAEIQAEATTLTVEDPRIQPDSRLFLTMRGNAGTHFWVSAVQAGSFTLQLAQPAATVVPFDYLIENAQPTEHPVRPNVFAHTTEQSQRTALTQRLSVIDEQLKKRQPNFDLKVVEALKDYVATPPPPKPEAADGRYIWTREKGLQPVVGR